MKAGLLTCPCLLVKKDDSKKKKERKKGYIYLVNMYALREMPALCSSVKGGQSCTQE